MTGIATALGTMAAIAIVGTADDDAAAATTAAATTDHERAATHGTFRLAAVLGRTFRNPIIVASLTGLLLAALQWELPEVLFGPFALIGAAAAPLALLTFGMSIAVPRTEGETTRPRELILVAVLRSVVSPFLALLLGHTLGLGQHQLLAVVAMAALPTAQNVLVYATQYGRGQSLARDAGVVTTTLAVPALLIIAATLS